MYIEQADFALIFIYLSLFGLNDLFVNKYLKSFFHKCIYYVILGSIGLIILTR